MPQYILGISAFYHDSASCLLRDGEIVAAASEERFTRKKGDAAFPRLAAAYCLGEAGIDVQDLAAVGFYDKPLLKFERILETYLSVAPRGFQSFLNAGPLWMKEKLFTDRELRRSVGGLGRADGEDAAPYEGEVLYAEHHESHAASAFFPSPFEDAAILTMDGVGEWATASIAVGRGGEVEILRELHWPDSLGLLYSAITYYAGFKVNSGEYKLMGLAPYGERKYVNLIYEHLIDLRDDGSFTLNRKFFSYITGLTMTSDAFNDLFGGPPRVPESDLTQKQMDLAHSVQVVCEEVTMRMARTAHAETGLSALCMAGGVALNCVANGNLLRHGPFKDLWIQPAAGDAGGALGVAQLIWHRHFGKPRRIAKNRSGTATDAMKGAYLGPAYDDADIEAFLRSVEAPFERVDREFIPKRIAQILRDGYVVGWFNGRMEFGPRALGSRSILGDPRNPRMQTIMNRDVKRREGFRPFAPSVLRDRVADWFEMDCDSPYMMFVAPVRQERRIGESREEHWPSVGMAGLSEPRSTIPAVTHVDYSARVHTVAEEANPDYYALLKAFESLTGCAVIVNTSLNVRGEPIACTPRDAYSCFMRTQMDYLVLGTHLLTKSGQPKNDALSSEPEFEFD